MSAVAHFILYVADQARATRFYTAVLGRGPRLDVPGMTEFDLGGQAVLGLMPEAGIRRLLGDRLPDPATAQGIARAELYLLRADAADCHARALAAGATELSPMSVRDWGHLAGYAQDPDGHVLACAVPGREPPARGSFSVVIEPAEAASVEHGVALGRMTLRKTFSGDLVGVGLGQMLTATSPAKGSAGYVAIERVSGQLHGREGSFVLQHSGSMHAGAPSLSITIVPQSGTGALAGIAGLFRLDVVDGRHDYTLVYTLPVG